MARRRYAFVSKPAQQCHRGKAERNALTETTVSEVFDQCSLREGVVSWEGIGHPAFVKGTRIENAC